MLLPGPRPLHDSSFIKSHLLFMFPTLHFCLDPHPSVNLSSPPSTVAICKNRGRGRGGRRHKEGKHCRLGGPRAWWQLSTPVKDNSPRVYGKAITFQTFKFSKHSPAVWKEPARGEFHFQGGLNPVYVSIHHLLWSHQHQTTSGEPLVTSPSLTTKVLFTSSLGTECRSVLLCSQANRDWLDVGSSSV